MTLNPFEILAIVSVCGVLFMAATEKSALLCGLSPQ